jgi:hypothetical protein
VIKKSRRVHFISELKLGALVTLCAPCNKRCILAPLGFYLQGLDYLFIGIIIQI